MHFMNPSLPTTLVPSLGQGVPAVGSCTCVVGVVIGVVMGVVVGDVIGVDAFLACIRQVSFLPLFLQTKVLPDLTILTLALVQTAPALTLVAGVAIGTASENSITAAVTIESAFVVWGSSPIESAIATPF